MIRQPSFLLLDLFSLPTELRPMHRIHWLIVSVICLGSCGEEPGPDRGANPGEVVAPWNVVLISIDSLRADHLSCYGYRRPTSPAIDALAEEGILFENANSQAPWTLPAHASLLTSRYPRTHQVTSRTRRLAPGTPTLAARLQEQGYSTHAVVSGPFMHSQFGMNQGFDHYDDELARLEHRQSHEVVTSPSIHDKTVRILEDVRPPFFLFLHYWDVHYDYIPPAPYDTMFSENSRSTMTSHRFISNPAICEDMKPRDLRHLIALYDGEIAWVDAHIGKLVEELRRGGWWDRTLLVLTSDHGDEFFEHGEKGHQHSLYQELIHVPLIVRVPEGPRGMRLRERVQLIDVMPTVLGWLDVPVSSALQGIDVHGWWEGQSPVIQKTFGETTKSRKSRREDAKTDSWCVYDGDYKLTQFAGDRYPVELYDLSRDRKEQSSLSDPQLRARLLGELEAWKNENPRGAGARHEGLDASVAEELNALGYVGDE